MSKIKILPHEELCPEGIVIENLPNETICEAALRNGVKIEHACEMSAACTTCHIVVRRGFESLDEASDIEEDFESELNESDADDLKKAMIIAQ